MSAWTFGWPFSRVADMQLQWKRILRQPAIIPSQQGGRTQQQTRTSLQDQILRVPLLPITFWVWHKFTFIPKGANLTKLRSHIFQLIIRKIRRYNRKLKLLISDTPCHFHFALPNDRFEPLKGTSPLLPERISLITSLLPVNRTKNTEWRSLRLRKNDVPSQDT